MRAIFVGVITIDSVCKVFFIDKMSTEDTVIAVMNYCKNRLHTLSQISNLVIQMFSFKGAKVDEYVYGSHYSFSMSFSFTSALQFFSLHQIR